jgi:hypothetical protein
MADRYEALNELFAFGRRPGGRPGVGGPHTDPATWVLQNVDLDKSAQLEVAKANVAFAKELLAAQMKHLEQVGRVLEKVT